MECVFELLVFDLNRLNHCINQSVFNGHHVMVWVEMAIFGYQKKKRHDV